MRSRTSELDVRLAQHLEREEIVLFQRPQRHAAEDAFQLVRWNATAWRLHDDVRPTKQVPARQITSDDEALAHLGDGVLFSFVDLLDAVAERFVRALEIANHLAQANGLERKGMIGPLARTVQREVLLHDSGAQDVGGNGHGNAVVVARETDHGTREALAERADHAQIELLERRRIPRGALEDRELRVDRHDRVVGALHVVDEGAAGGNDDRLTEARDVLEQRRAFQIAGRNLVRRNIEFVQEIGAGQVECGGEEIHAELRRQRLQLTVLLEPELQELAVLAIGRTEAVLVVVGFVVRGTGVKTLVVALLQLDRVRAGQFRFAEQFAGLIEAALVVVSDFRDDIAPGLIADLVLPDSHGSCQWCLPTLRQPVAAARPADPTRSRRARYPARRDQSSPPPPAPGGDRND